MRRPGKIILTVVVLAFFSANSFGFESIPLGPDNTDIKASIAYSVIGKYRAEFSEFTGEVMIDEQTDQIRSVYLKIAPASITSNCSWCDKIVRSKRLLSVEEFPDIVFRSDKITKDADGYKANGTFSLHGITKEVSFPFYVEGLDGSLSERPVLKAGGEWLIDRKEFDITWNRLLDKGGVLVGNYITVDWVINAVRDH